MPVEAFRSRLIDIEFHRPKLPADAVIAPGKALPRTERTSPVVAIGTSTGGTQALEAILTNLPADIPGIVIVQHMPEKFTAMFAERLNSICQIEVREARHGDHVRRGLALVAPGGHHLLLRRHGNLHTVDIVDGPLVTRHKPSVDVLFRSIAQAAGHNALAIILTGMGDDGALGMKEAHDAGARTIAQDEKSCVVFGMPKEAIRHGGIDEVLPLDRIPSAITAYARSR
jgi:two-component system chemotaxis response regulator CheB